MPDLRLIDPDGVPRIVPEADVPAALQSGWHAETQSDISRETSAAARGIDYGGIGGAVKAGLYGAARGATLGASDVAFRVLGANAKDLSGLRAENPYISAGAELAGTLLPAVVAPGSLLARTPAGALSRVAMEGVQAGRATGGLRGAAAVIGASGLEGAGQTAGAYLSDVALGDRKLSAEGVAGAIGSGFAFGAAGGAAALGIEKGAMAARRMFARVADGGERAANQAEQAWRTQYQSAVESHDAAVDAAKAQLASAHATRQQAGLARDRASAATADIRAIARDLDAAHTAATGLDDKIAAIEAASHPAVSVGNIDDLERLVGEHSTARSELDDILRRLDESTQAELSPYSPTIGVPMDEFGPRRSGRAPITPVATADETSVLRKRAETVKQPDIFTVGDEKMSLTTDTKPWIKGGNDRTYIEVTRKLPDGSDEWIGTAAFEHRDGSLYPDTVEVADIWQRKGIGTRMYEAAEKSTGKRIVQSDKQTTMGEKFSAKFRSRYTEPDSLTGLLRGTQEKLAAGESMKAIGAPVRGEYQAAKAGKRQEWRERNAPMAREEISANKMRDLEIAHDAAIDRGAIDEARAIEQQMTVAGRRPGAVDDVALVAPAITKYERKSAEIAEALGDAAPPAAREHAAAFRKAENEADRKMTDRATRAIDDYADRRPSANLPAKDQIAAAKRDQLTADAAYKRARVAETEAKIGLREAKEARGLIPDMPVPVTTGAAPPSMLGNVAAAVGLAGELDVLGMPSARDIPVIGPLLSMYIKYRALKATVGRFAGRITANGDTRAAALAARTKDRIVKAVDRTLGLVERVAPKTRGTAVAGSAAIGRRIFDDGDPDAGKGATPQQHAAVRIREIIAANTRPELITQMVRREMRGVIDPDLLAAAEQHLIARFAHLASIVPKPPPDNEYAKRPWTPSRSATHELNQRLAVIHDPEHALAAGIMSPAAADTFRTVYPLLYELAKQRLIDRVGDLKSPMPRADRLRAASLFQLPIDISLDPSHIAIVREPVKLDQAPSPSQAPDLSQMYNPQNTRIR